MISKVDPPIALAQEPGPERLASRTQRWSGRQASKSSRREEILRSVGSVLRDSRLSSLTMRSIAEKLGITKGNLYYYFKDKRDILYHCHMRSVELSLSALSEVNAIGGSASQRLKTVLTRHINGILEQGLGSILLTDLETLTANQKKKYIAKRDSFERGVRALIEEGVRSGEFHCENVALAGFTILGSINWTSKWYHADGSLTANEIANGMSEFLLRALLRTRSDPRSPATTAD